MGTLWFTNCIDNKFKHLFGSGGGWKVWAIKRKTMTQLSQKGLLKLDICLHNFIHHVHLTHIITKS